MGTAAAAAADETTTEAAPPPLSSQQKMAVARAARAFTSYGESRKVMAKIAKAIVNLRLTFEKDDRPDFRGETPQYRGAIASLYEAAISDPEERESFKVAIRYWVGKEFAARVDAGTLSKEELEAAGIVRAVTPEGTPAPREPRRAATSAEQTSTGVIVDGAELTPPEVLVEAERMVAEHVADASLGPVLAMQSIGRALGPVVAGLRDETLRARLPGRSLRASAENVLTLALDAALLSGTEVEEFFATWFAQAEEHALAAAEVVA